MFAVVWPSENVYFEYDIWTRNYTVLVVLEQQHKSEITFALCFLCLQCGLTFVFLFYFVNQYI